MLSAKGAGSCKHAAAGKSFPQKRALKVRIKEALASVPHIAFVKFDAVFAEKDAEVNRAVSASEFLTKRRPGALPQASINIAPLALNRYALIERRYRRISRQ